jgi:hypothetical protein
MSEMSVHRPDSSKRGQSDLVLDPTVLRQIQGSLARSAKQPKGIVGTVPVKLILTKRYELLNQEVFDVLGEVTAETDREIAEFVNKMIYDELPSALSSREISDAQLEMRELKAGRFARKWKPNSVLNLFSKGEERDFEAGLADLCRQHPELGIRPDKLVSALNNARSKSKAQNQPQ